jgi:hypothetical protein
MDINNKAIRITCPKAIRLAKIRAKLEGRSAANAVAQTIIEALGDRYCESDFKHNFRDNIIEKDAKSQE